MKGRRLEKRRQAWDRQAAACAEDGFYALNRDMEFRTEEQRQYWQAELDRAKAELDRAKAELDRAKAELNRAKAELDRAKAELGPRP